MTQVARVERPFSSANGYLMIVVGAVLIGLGIASVVRGVAGLWGLLLALALILGGVAVLIGLYMLQPNTAAILLLFGEYRGTDRADGRHHRQREQPVGVAQDPVAGRGADGGIGVETGGGGFEGHAEGLP